MAGFERVTTDGVRRGQTVTLVVDGTPVTAFTGESVATVLLAEDRLTLRHTPKVGAPRGVFCAMGVCFECLVTVDGVSQVRACVTPVRDGMLIDTGCAPTGPYARGDRSDRKDVDG